jgi:hypothetical protein
MEGTMKGSRAVLRAKFVAIGCFLMVVPGWVALASAQSISADAATGVVPGSAVSQSSAIAYDIDRPAVVISKAYGSDYFAITTGNPKQVWRFRIYAFQDAGRRVDPEAFTVTAIDANRSGEKIRIKVYKESAPALFVVAAAISPKAATVGLTPVSDGDVVYVEVTYPAGFLYGNTGSGYVLNWVLQNTGWVQ